MALLLCLWCLVLIRGFGKLFTRHDLPPSLPPAAYVRGVADTVYNMLEDNQGSKFTEAGLHLRKAAGLFQRLHEVMSALRRRARNSAQPAQPR